MKTGTNDFHLLTPSLQSQDLVGLSFISIALFLKLPKAQVALSTTEAEYIAMSFSLRDMMHFMYLVAEIRNLIFQVICNAPHLFCKVFEDNAQAPPSHNY